MTVLHSLREFAATVPEQPLYSFYGPRGDRTDTRTQEESWARAEELATALRAAGLRSGDPALLVYPPGLAFVDAFIACLRAGIVPVPLPPPRPGGLGGFVQVAVDCDARAVLSDSALAKSRGFQRARAALEEHPHSPGIPWHDTEVLSGTAELPPLPGPESLAFLQYTSGSTRAPQGVRITHANLVHQLQSNTTSLHFDPGCVSVTWVPHYHDFALISGILGSMAGHGHLVLMDPVAFLRRPARWGELISAYRATHAWAPDFGYALVVQRTTAEEREAWDFSSLRVLMTAAEPIRARTVDAFFEACAGTGMDPRAFCPAYGLAEHSVAVTVFGRQRQVFSREGLERDGVLRVAAGDEPGVELFGCGPPGPGVALRIVDPTGCTALAAGRVGEIWVDSPSKADGYYGHAEASAATFRAVLVGETGEWLRTGDLGGLFGGELFVTGRLKDLILLRGRNVAPQDVEAAVGDRPEFKTGRTIAFGAEIDDEERLIVVAEVGDPEPTPEVLEACGRAALTALQQTLDVVPYRLLLCPPQTIPKTTSGKVQRRLCRKRWLAGELKHYAAVGGTGA